MTVRTDRIGQPAPRTRRSYDDYMQASRVALAKARMMQSVGDTEAAARLVEVALDYVDRAERRAAEELTERQQEAERQAAAEVETALFGEALC